MHRKYIDVTNVAMLYFQMRVKCPLPYPQKISLYGVAVGNSRCSNPGLSGEMSRSPCRCKVSFKVCNSKLEHVTDKHKMAKAQRERFGKTL